MKFVFSPDVILCGWLGWKHHLTNWPTFSLPPSLSCLTCSLALWHGVTLWRVTSGVWNSTVTEYYILARYGDVSRIKWRPTYDFHKHWSVLRLCSIFVGGAKVGRGVGRWEEIHSIFCLRNTWCHPSENRLTVVGKRSESIRKYTNSFYDLVYSVGSIVAKWLLGEYV